MRAIFQYALAICLILGVAGDSLAMPSPREEVELAKMYLPVDLNVEVTWDSCGTWNGYYWGAFDLIVLCNENLDQGVEVARSIYLHELGHAYTFSRNMTYERWNGNYEAAADEFSAVMDIVQGHPDDLVKMALLHMAWDKAHPRRKDDPHPTGQTRADMFLHLYWGYLWPKTTWGAEWRDALQFWHNQLLKEA